MVAHQKMELRDRMRARRSTLSDSDVATRSAAIRKRLEQLPAFAGARRVLAYASRGHEVRTHELIQQLLAENRAVGVPAFDAARGVYVAALIERFPENLVEGQLRILEPRPENRRPVGLDFFDVLLVPGVAFDVRGGRLGRGKGYYDRLLEAAPGTKIGLAYDCQIVPAVPLHDHDVHMDYVATETRLITCRRDSS